MAIQIDAKSPISKHKPILHVAGYISNFTSPDHGSLQTSTDGACVM